MIAQESYELWMNVFFSFCLSVLKKNSSIKVIVFKFQHDVTGQESIQCNKFSEFDKTRIQIQRKKRAHSFMLKEKENNFSLITFHERE